MRQKEISRFCQLYPQIDRESHASNYDALSRFENTPIERITDEQALSYYIQMVFMYRVPKTASEEEKFNHPQIQEISEQRKKLYDQKNSKQSF